MSQNPLQIQGKELKQDLQNKLIELQNQAMQEYL